MGRVTLFVLFRVICALATPVVVFGQDEDQKQSQKNFRKWFSVDFSGIVNTYKPDNGDSYQLGTYPVQFEYQGGVGLGTGGRPFGYGEMDGVHEKVTSSDLPEPVVAWGKGYSPTVLNQTSLRLQNSWGGSLGFYLTRDLRVGARFYENSWRYDYLGYGAGTTIPYVKGIQKTPSAFVNYTHDGSGWRVMLDAGGGRAAVNFVQGVESWLADGYEKPLSSLSGTPISVSGGLGKVFEYSGSKIIPFIRYGMIFTNLAGGTDVRRSLLDFGIQMDVH
jgi:hypothetical protein